MLPPSTSLALSNASRLAKGIALIAAMHINFGCGQKSVQAEKTSIAQQASQTPATKNAALSVDPMLLPVTQELNTLVKYGLIESAIVREQIRIAGKLELDGYKTARIGAPVTGRISDIRGVIGQVVRQGEPLAEISSQELTSAQLAFLKAHSSEQLAIRAVERAELLLASDVIGSAELQRRQNELTVARVEKRAGADQLRILGLSARSVDQLETTGKLIAAIPISATQTGTIIERKVTLGQVVQPSDFLFVISDLRSLWAAAEIPEQEALFVKRGQKVEIEIPALGNEKRTGSIVFVADVVNPETRTVRVGVDLDNPNKMLKPQMLITMLAQGQASQKLIVPASAVVRESDTDHLFVEMQPGLVKLLKVKLGPAKDGVRQVLEKLPEGRRIVIDGGFHLNTERIKRNLEKTG